MFKTKYYYVNARYTPILRYRIKKGYYYSLRDLCLRKKNLFFNSVPCDGSRIFKDYYSLDEEFLIYVECERRYS